MPIPQRIPQLYTSDDVCKLMARWMIHYELARRIHLMATFLPFELEIISGFRTRDRQLELEREGRPAADPDRSTHCSCPATGADLRIVGLSPGPYEKALFGEAAVKAGLRWGGGSPVDPETGIPSDWNHVDMGPRTS